jgi:hypothetical protein
MVKVNKDLLHSPGQATGKAKEILELIFSHLWGRDMSFRYK